MKFQMHKTIATRLILTLILVCGLTVTSLTAQTSQVVFVENSARTQVAPNGVKPTIVKIGNDCEEELKTANQR